MSLNKINYFIDPKKLTKEESGKSLGKWKEYQTKHNDQFDSGKPYFVVCHDGIVIIDFDIPTKAKIEKDEENIKKNKEKGRKYTPVYAWLAQEWKQKILDGETLEPWPVVKKMLEEFSFPTSSDNVYIIKTGNGGFHYYLKLKNPANFKVSPDSFMKTKDFISVDIRTPVYKEGDKESGGGLVYGAGTKWKDSEKYEPHRGGEHCIPKIEGWKVAWFLGILNHEVHLKDEPVINLCEFLNGKIDLHGVLKNRGQGHEMVVCRETMYLLKELGYTQDEVNEVFITLPNYNQKKTLDQIKAWWDKETDTKRVKAHKIGETFNKIEEIRNNVCSWNRSILYKELKTKTQEIRICDSGIFKDDITSDKAGNVEIFSETLWAWDSFSIKRVFVEPDDKEKYKRFTFELDGAIYEEKTLKQMTNMIADWCLLKANAKALFGKMIKEVIDEFKPPICEYSNICGFTEDGWRLPGKYYISFTSVQKDEIKVNIDYMLENDVNEKDAKEMMKLLYDNITVDQVTKDIGFAWTIISPFMYVLREHTELMPFLSLGGIDGDRGKSALGKVLVNWIWNVLGKSLINTDQIASKSRALEFFSSSTFPIGIDDCQNLTDACNSEIKTYLTSETNFLRKNPYQDSEIKRPLQAPILLTYNAPPPIFDDKAFLTRGINRQMVKPFTKEEIERYDNVKGKITRGYLGKYIIEYTKDWTLKELLKLYKSITFPEDIASTSSNKEILNRTMKIYKILVMGKELMDKIFGIQLKLEDVVKNIRETRKINNQGILDLVQRQLSDGIKKEIYNKEGNSEKAFRPMEKWIRSEVYEGINQEGNHGYYYTYTNLQDAIKNSTINRNMNLPEFCNILQDYMPEDVILEVKKHNNQYTNNKSINAIWIPKDFNDIFRSSTLEKIKREMEEKIKTNIMEINYDLPEDKLHIAMNEYTSRFGIIDVHDFYRLIKEVRKEMGIE